MPPFRDRFELKKDDTLYGMTLKGVFFLLGQYIYGGNCYFVNGPKTSRSAVIVPRVTLRQSSDSPTGRNRQ